MFNKSNFASGSYLLKNGLLLTQNQDRKVYRGDILVADKRIIAVAPDLGDHHVTIDCSEKLICPAFINPHAHLGETIFRGRADGLNLEEYLDFTEQAWRHYSGNKDTIRKITAHLTLIEAATNGIGTLCFGRGWEAVSDVPLKMFMGYPLMLSPKLSDYAHQWTIQYEEVLRQLASNRNIKLGIFIHSLLMVNPEILKAVSELCKKSEVNFITLHVAETKTQIEKTQSVWGDSEINVLKKYGLLTPKTILVHCNWLSETEMDLIADAQAKVVICPTANLKLHSGLPNFTEMLRKGIRMSLATDGLATNNSSSLLEAAKIAGLLWQVAPQDLLDMITIKAAECLGIDYQTGTIDVGKCADLVFFDLDDASLYPLETVLSNLIFASPQKPRALTIDGNLIVFNGESSWLNQKELLASFDLLSKSFMA